MAIDLTGKPILITGASSGIGRETALHCARAGMPVVLAARRADRLNDAVAQITREGGRAIAVPLDVDDPAACAAAVARCIDAFGSIYSVFANAGYGIEAPVHETTDEMFRAIFQTNFYGTLNTIRPALEPMKAAGQGHILICSSCLAKFAVPYYSAYSATKAAQNHIGRAMSIELRPFGIRTSTVHPIGTRTEFFDTTAKNSADGTKMSEHTPAAFMQKSSTVARAVVRCLRRPRPEVWTSLPVHLGMSLATFTPRISDYFLRRMLKP